MWRGLRPLHISPGGLTRVGKEGHSAIDLSIEEGESVGYVGPNGAGKSTTVKMLTGILVPSAGEVRVRGLTPHRQRIETARNIGVVFGQRTQLWWDLPVQESLRLLGDIYEVPADRFARSLAECVELLDLEPCFWPRYSLARCC
ncbi:MAG TPA: ATP-binding cassette domain-containing protein [Roseiflexaceae bacterium]|nr:ATP-binding cassette domain-containing protein [Roseiflexaceae bacterium]